jgi:peptide deformylase
MGPDYVREPAEDCWLALMGVPAAVFALAYMIMSMMVMAVIDISGVVAVRVGHNPQDGRRSRSTLDRGAWQMSVRPLRYLGDPLLRTSADPVTRFDAALGRLIEDLLDTVQEPGRAGLAANQIGSSLAAFAYNVDEELGYLINPRIIELEGEQEGLEGCLSVPDVTAVRRRAARALVTGVNLDREQVTMSGTDELARCFQHEIDHLHGELYIDKLDGDERRRVMRQINAC